MSFSITETKTWQVAPPCRHTGTYNSAAVPGRSCLEYGRCHCSWPEKGGCCCSLACPQMVECSQGRGRLYLVTGWGCLGLVNSFLTHPVSSSCCWFWLQSCGMPVESDQSTVRHLLKSPDNCGRIVLMYPARFKLVRTWFNSQCGCNDFIQNKKLMGLNP